MSELLRVRDLRVRFPLAGGFPGLPGGGGRRYVDVVHGVSLDLQPGKTLAVVGESGSGKTTLAMALAGLAPVLSGEVRFGGSLLDKGGDGRLRPDRRRIALMFQDAVGSLSPRMTVRTLLAEPYRIHPGLTDDPDRAALELLDLVGLGDRVKNRYPHQLSGGQARRVVVARALALRPDLLIADEPTAGLDVSIQGDVLNLLADLQQEMGLAIVLITHNLNIIRHVAGAMAIMYLGRFVEQGLSSQVFEHPRHPYTAALLAANPNSNPDAVVRRTELSGEVPGLLKRPMGCEFHTRCPRVQAQCREAFPPSQGSGPGHRWNCFFPIEGESEHVE